MTISDHRTRVAAEKRERMRARLIECAILVFARKGADAAVIEDVILLAEVSRGTFYNYFRTNDELMTGVLDALGHELIALVDAVVTTHRDPAERVACGLRMVLHTAARFPMLARFVARVGLQETLGRALAIEFLSRDIEAGLESGRFQLPNVEVGRVLVLGAVQAALVALARESGLPDDLPDDLALHLLLALGMTRASARRVAALPLPDFDIPEDALLARCQRREELLPE